MADLLVVAPMMLLVMLWMHIKLLKRVGIYYHIKEELVERIHILHKITEW